MIKIDQEKIDLFTALGNLIAIAANNVRLCEELKSPHIFKVFFQ